MYSRIRNTIATCLLLYLHYTPSWADHNFVFPVYSTVCINIDGSTDEWSNFSLPSFHLSHYRSNSGSWNHPGFNDIDAYFSILSDNDNIYIIISVTDDRIITTNQAFGWGWSDDSIEICFDGDRHDPGKPFFDSNDGQIILSRTPSDDVHLEGVVPYLYIAQIPGFWEARGVEAALALTDSGYTAEISIPHEILEWQDDLTKREIGLNIRVFDDDIGGKHRIDGYLTWAEDTANTCFWKTESYNPVTFVRSEPKCNTDSIRNEGKVLTSVSSEGKTLADIHCLTTVISSMANDNWEAALNKLSEMSDSHLKLILEGVLLLHAGQAEKGVGCLFRAETKAQSTRIGDWCREYPAAFAKEINYSDELSQRYMERDYATAGKTACFILFHDPKHVEARHQLSHALRNMEWEKTDTVEMLTILDNLPDNKFRHITLLASARYHFIHQKDEVAKRICFDLLDMELDDETTFQAKTILLAIKNRQNKED